jgi:membrane-associated phospholipid phosphatase
VIARFWSDFSYTVTPPGHWNQIAQELAAAKDLDLAAKVRLFAILNVTLHDVAIACWDAKYTYNFWRPVTAIRAAAKDSNDRTEPDSNWMPLLNTPAFPEYVSGHSAFSGAAAIILAKFNSGDTLEFSVPSDSLPGKRRSFQSLWACAEEVSQSRLYGGIHFQSALTDGLALGRKIADHVLATEFVSLKNRAQQFSVK